MFYNSLKNLKIKRLIENVPTSKARSVAMGLAELKGKIESEIKRLPIHLMERLCLLAYSYTAIYEER